MYREITNLSQTSKFQYSWNSTVGFLNEEIINKYKELCEKSKNNKLKNNSTVYQSSMSNYPVYKLKNYIQENKLNIKKARKWNKIDTIIIDKDFLNKLHEHSDLKNKKYTLIPRKEILKSKHVELDDWRLKRSDDVSFFYITSKNITSKNFIQWKDYDQIEGIPIEKCHGMKNIYDNIEFITELFDNIEKYNLHVVLDSSIDKEINNGTIIDLETYEVLYNMLNSDESNVKIAKEIIANCEYNQSRPYILFLASVFPSLLVKSDNKNYHTVHRILKVEQRHFNTFYSYTTHFESIPCILQKCPEFKSTFALCLKTHLNILYKNELIREIVSF
jgi:hypothetical protein